MSSIQSTTTLVSKTLEILETSSDWNDWLTVIEVKANNLQVWQYINPDTTTIAPHEPESISLDMAIENETNLEIIRFTQLTAAQLSTYRFLKEEYKEDMANYRRIATGIAEISNHIMSTISRSNFTLLTDTAPRAALITLRLRLAPSTLAQERLVAQQYTKVKQGPGKANNIDKWMLTWENTYNEAIRLDIPDIAKNRAIFDFIEAIKPVDAIWAGSIEVFMSMAESNGSEALIPSMAALLERYRNHRRTEQLKASTVSYNQSVFPATFQGQSASAQATNGKPAKEWTSKCLCGMIHPFRECYYLVDTLRPRNWRPDPAIQAAIDDKLKNPRLQDIVAKLVQRAKQKTKGKSLSNESQASAEPPPILGSFATSFTASSLDVTSSASPYRYHLIDSWILDSGADVHICNDAEALGFKHESIAPISHTIYAGKDAYLIEAYGQIRITVDTPNGTGIVILNNVALVPEFLTNVVSATLLEKKGVYVDAEKNRLQQQGHIFCLFSQMRNH